MKTRVIICVVLLILIFLFGQNNLMALKGPNQAHPWAEDKPTTPMNLMRTSYQNNIDNVILFIYPYVIYFKLPLTSDGKLQNKKEDCLNNGVKNEGGNRNFRRN